MKKLILSLLIVLFFAFSNVSAEEMNAVISNETAKPGEAVDITVSLQNNSGIVAAFFRIEYDQSRLELISAKDEQLLDDSIFSETYDAYPYILLWNSASMENITTDGVLATLTFKVKDNAQAGMAYINIIHNTEDVFDVDLNTVPVTAVNGGITVITNNTSPSRGGSNDGIRVDKTEETTTSEPDADEDVTEENNRIILAIGKTEAEVFGETMQNDVAPIIRNDRTMLPARFVAESLGATVEWNENTKTVTVKSDRMLIEIIIDSPFACVNGEIVDLDSPAFIENDRTYTPLRFIAENLSATVEWIEDKKEIVITKTSI